MTKIREIIEKYAEEISTERGFESLCVYAKDFDKLEQELQEHVDKFEKSIIDEIVKRVDAIDLSGENVIGVIQKTDKAIRNY